MMLRESMLEKVLAASLRGLRNIGQTGWVRRRTATWSNIG